MVVLPVIAAFASAGAAVTAAGGIAAAMGTVSGFLSIAGAALTTIGAVTGKKDLMKIGGFMSLGGGIGTAVNAASAGAGAANGAQEAFRASELASQAGAGAQAAAAPLAEAAGAISPELARSAVTDFGDQIAPSLYERGGDIARNNGMNAAMESGFAAPGVSAPSVAAPGFAAPELANPALATPGVQSAAGRIAEGAQTMDSSQLSKYLRTGYEALKPIANGAMDFASKNKELMAMGGNVLNSMYGPEAELNNMRRSSYDRQNSIYDRQMRNRNSPVKLNFGGT